MIIGEGYNRRDLSDMWAYDVAADPLASAEGRCADRFLHQRRHRAGRRRHCAGNEHRTPDDKTTCNILLPVRTTYAYRMDARTSCIRIKPSGATIRWLKRDPDEIGRRRTGCLVPGNTDPTPEELSPGKSLGLADEPGRKAPTRTWRSVTYVFRSWPDSLLGGGDCGTMRR